MKFYWVDGYDEIAQYLWGDHGFSRSNIVVEGLVIASYFPQTNGLYPWPAMKCLNIAEKKELLTWLNTERLPDYGYVTGPFSLDDLIYSE